MVKPAQSEVHGETAVKIKKNTFRHTAYMFMLDIRFFFKEWAGIA
jgi:hypothetical protein